MLQKEESTSNLTGREAYRTKNSSMEGVAFELDFKNLAKLDLGKMVKYSA